jgi:hypothetical protein
VRGVSLCAEDISDALDERCPESSGRAETNILEEIGRHPRQCDARSEKY